LTRATYLNIVEESFMTMVFPGGSGLFQQDNDPGLQIPQVSIQVSLNKFDISLGWCCFGSM